MGALYSPTSADLDARTWLHATIKIDAFPFSGAINTVLTVADIDAYRERVTRCSAVEHGQSVLRGGRAAPVTPSGDDPFTRLTFLVVGDARMTVTPLNGR